MAKKTPNVILTNQDLLKFKKNVDNPEIEDKLRLRYLIVLMSNEGKSIKEITEELHINRITAQKWIERYNREGEYGLFDKPQGYWGREDMLPYCNMGPQSITDHMRIVSVCVTPSKFALVLEVRLPISEKLVNIGNFISNDTNMFNSMNDMKDEHQFFWTIDAVLKKTSKDASTWSQSLESEMWKFFLDTIKNLQVDPGSMFFVITTDKTMHAKKIGPVRQQYLKEDVASFYEQLKKVLEKNNNARNLINRTVLQGFLEQLADVVQSKSCCSFLWVMRDLYFRTVADEG